jgi:PAS domain S-box-containing protein
MTASKSFEWESRKPAPARAGPPAHRPFRDLNLGRVADDGRPSLQHKWRPVFIAGGFRGYRGVGRDVSEEKQAEAALRETEARLRGMLAMSADWMWEQDANLRFVSFSSGTPRKAGVKPSTSLGKTRFELPFEWESEDAKRRHTQDLEAHRSFRGLKLKRVDDHGKVRHTSISGEPIFDKSGAFAVTGVTHAHRGHLGSRGGARADALS